jgi:Tfp pilus assembly protein FimV
MSAATMEMGRTSGSIRIGASRHTGGTRTLRRAGRSTHVWLAPIAWACVLACAIALVGVLPTARDLVPSRTTAAISVTVAPADTLWSIAAAHRLSGMSTAQTVEAIVEANSLSGRSIRAGSVLAIPAAGVSGTAFAQVTSAQMAR